MKENQRCREKRILKDYFQPAKENLVEQVNIIYIKHVRGEKGDIRELSIE